MALNFKDYPFVADSTRLGGGYSDYDGDVTVPVSVFDGKVPDTIDVIDHSGREAEYIFHAVTVDTDDQLTGYSYWADDYDAPAVNLILVPDQVK